MRARTREGAARRVWRTPLLVAVLGLALVGDAWGDAPGDGKVEAPSASAAAAAADEAAPAPPAPPTPIDLAAGWPVELDRKRIDDASWRLLRAFDEGSRAGLTALAEASWPPGITADLLLACRFSEPTASYGELDERDFSVWIRMWDAVPAPRWRYPPTGESLAPYGLRVYRVQMQETVNSTLPEESLGSGVFEAHAAVDGDGKVWVFAACDEYLPGGDYAHRVTDGEVGGYTDEEQWGDLLLGFRNLGPLGQQDFCDDYRTGGAKATRDWFVDGGYFPPTLTVDVVRAFLDPRCPEPVA